MIKVKWFSGLFVGALAAAPVCWLIIWLIVQPEISYSNVLDQPLKLLLLCCIYPVLEELTFRGAVQGYLYQQDYGAKTSAGISIANIITSIIFSATHLIYHSLLWSISIIFPSLLFGLLRDRYNTVVPCIVLHVIYNSGYYLIFGVG